MNDLFGREVKRGDIIVYGVKQLSGFNKFTETRIGVVSKILPKGRKWVLRDSSTNKPIIDSLGNKQYIDTIDKVTFYPLDNSILNPFNVKLTKSGKRKYNPYLSAKFLIIDKSSLSADYTIIYNEVCRIFNII